MIHFLKYLVALCLLIPLSLSNQATAQTPTPQLERLTQSLATASTREQPEILHQLFQQVHLSQPRKALQYAKEALRITTAYSDRVGQGHALHNLGIVNDILGNYSTAMQNYVQAIDLFSELNMQKDQAIILSHIGQLHRKQNNPLKALDIYMQALAIHRQLGDMKSLGVTHNNMGNAYKDMSHFTNAINAFEKALTIFDSLHLAKEKTYVQNDIAEVFILKSNYQEAEKLLQNAYQAKIKLLDHYGIAITTNNLAQLYLKQEKLRKALFFAQRSYNKAEYIQAKKEIMEAAQTLAMVHEQLGDYPQAYRYEKRHANLQDSIFNEQNLQFITQMQTNFDLNKKESEIELLTKNKIIQEKEDKIQKQWIGMLLGGVAALIGIISTLIWYSQRLRKKSNLLLEQNENVRLTQENTYKLSEFGKQITSLLTVQAIAKADYTRLQDLLPVDVVGIGIYQETKGTLVFEEVIELGKRLPRMEVQTRDSSKLSAWCFNHKKELLINRVATEYTQYIEERSHMAGVTKETGSVIYVPLIGSKKHLGVLTIQAFKENAYTQYHLDLVKNLALYTAIALENAQAFQELRNAVDKLINAQEELLQARKMASISELTKGIAHELNNPINFVLNGTELIHSRVLELQQLAQAYTKLEHLLPPDKVKEIQQFKALIEFDFMHNDLDTLLEDIKEGAKRSANIVKGLQIFSTPDTGELKHTDIHTGLEDALALLGNQIRYKGIHIIKDYEQTGTIYINPIEINQVLVNLLTNAIQAVNGDGKIAIQTRLFGDQLKVSVKDNGVGIPENLQDKIFDPFFTTREAGEGTGLGLSIVYSVVKKHHGKVDVHSQLDEGSEFVIWLPKEQSRGVD